ncbi:triacylglycerol lipase [Saccharopolyspora antimicrobica]|uniref:Triacylglycerol lipase n=1 Tax=Saccharopolyspora antimicrobica TaxID=455193 RepID=A0A1I4TT71_9PSEU|nr:lipase family protein [Saccharopolyspora antimicrobica]RKT88539.1 triacylglycerol lipase [Saccharopolyspora antimicrobica]SFM79785.1 triacylglycerol lipase [Saccharopolyspora antimicrobica]
MSAFDHTVSDYQLPHAYWLARAAKLAYSDEATIRDTVREWGFDRCEYFHAELDSSFPIEDTQAYAAGSDRMIVVAFRGTEPAKIKDWLSDANALVAPGPAGKGLVHEGFSRALDSIYSQVRDAVQRFRDAEQTLWFTGHSLGGALAMLASARMYFESPQLLPDGVYTFGQPRTCDRFLAGPYDDAFPSRVFRFVNNNDLVAQLPPEPFHHVAAIRYFGADGKLRERMTVAGGLTDRVKGFTSDAFAPASDGVRDHQVDRYVDLLEKSIG